MKKSISILKLIISTILILGLLVSSISAYSNTLPDYSLIDNGHQLGKVIPAGITEAVFADQVDYSDLMGVQYTKEISIRGDDVNVALTLFLGSTPVQLSFSGKMFTSFRHTEDTPVYIGAFDQNDESDFDIIYFEISSDSSPYSVNKDYRNAPSVTTYLRNKDGTIYDLGSSLDTPVFLNSIKNQAPSDNDITWFINYIDGTYEVVNNSESRSVYSAIWTGDTHTLKYPIAGFEHWFVAIPYIDFSIGDVPSAGTAMFSMSLKIAESHRYRTIGDTSWTMNTEDFPMLLVLIMSNYLGLREATHQLLTFRPI